jgi:hypothetical protein
MKEAHLAAAALVAIAILLWLAGVKLAVDMRRSLELTQLQECVSRPWLDTRPPC